MVASDRTGSILAVDCGTVLTKAVLFDRVDGESRFVASGEAPTSPGTMGADVAESARHAARQISHVTSRQFFADTGTLISPQSSTRRGVDAFTATVSAGEPLRVLLSGLVADLSVASAKRAAAGAYSQVEAVPYGVSGADPDHESRVRAIRTSGADVVCLAGGTDGGAEQQVLQSVRAATLACSMLERDRRPILLYAGNASLRRQVADIVGDEAELRVVDNVRPTLEDEHLHDAQKELQALFKESKLTHLPGMSALMSWSPVPITPTAQAFGQVVQYLGHLGEPGRGILGIDVGGANTTVAAMFDEQLSLTINTGLGAAFGAERLIEERGPDAIARWIPESISDQQVRATLISKSAYPASIPQVENELWVEQAVICEALAATLDTARPGWRPGSAQPHAGLAPLLDTILLSGTSLTRVPRPGQAALLVLNAVQPIGVTTLVLDTYGLAPALGSAATIKPLAAVEALDAGGFTNLATVVAPVGGEANPGDTILSLTVSYADGRELEADVSYGNLEVLPLPLGQEAVLELRPRLRFDVGLGGRGKAGKLRVSGGSAGLIIDARGRPLSLPDSPERRQELMRQWLYDVGG